jgi:hypothetical protein
MQRVLETVHHALLPGTLGLALSLGFGNGQALGQIGTQPVKKESASTKEHDGQLKPKPKLPGEEHTRKPPIYLGPPVALPATHQPPVFLGPPITVPALPPPNMPRPPVFLGPPVTVPSPSGTTIHRPPVFLGPPIRLSASDSTKAKGVARKTEPTQPSKPTPVPPTPTPPMPAPNPTFPTTGGQGGSTGSQGTGLGLGGGMGGGSAQGYGGSVSLCNRDFNPLSFMPARHCFVWYHYSALKPFQWNGQYSIDPKNTATFDPSTAGTPDADPNMSGTVCPATYNVDPACVQQNYELCENFNLATNNCCSCALQALTACGATPGPGDFPAENQGMGLPAGYGSGWKQTVLNGFDQFLDFVNYFWWAI